MPVPERITCVDCGGAAHRLGAAPEMGWQEDDVVAYRCEDCLDRWDLVVDVGDLDEADPDHPV